MDPLIILLIIVVSILTILLVVVGVHVVQILREIKRTISKVNNSIEGVDSLVHNLHNPFGNQGGVMEGVTTGLKVAEAFVHWLKKDKEEEDEE
ncbi:hypothetical protein ACFL1M_02090 [Patescibacteria group bacterium]